MKTATPLRELSLEDRYTAVSGPILLGGMQALVRLMLDVRWLDARRGFDTGVFVSGYPGSPLGGLDLELHRAARHLEPAGVVFRPGLNEELAATAVGGTQLLGELPSTTKQGVTGFWYGKAPGLDRAADALRHSNFSGTAPLGGAVALIGDDPPEPMDACARAGHDRGAARARAARRGDVTAFGRVEWAEDRHRPRRLSGHR